MVEAVFATTRVKTIALAVPGWVGHRAGQHVDIRLTGSDGRQSVRSYSIASGPEDEGLLLTVERLDGGEVSPYLVDELRVGDELELRGPIGENFGWGDDLGGPLLLVADGCGLVPLRSILRHHRAIGSRVPVRVLCSAYSLERLIYHEELMEMAAYDLLDISVTLTGEESGGWRGYRRRIDDDLLAEVAWSAAERPLTFICGPTAFVEAVAGGLVAMGYDPGRIRKECFGRT